MGYYAGFVWWDFSYGGFWFVLFDMHIAEITFTEVLSQRSICLFAGIVLLNLLHTCCFLVIV